jgi:hypothetical protein
LAGICANSRRTKPAPVSEIGNVFEVTYAPFGVAATQILIERLVARGRMPPFPPVRSIKEKQATRRQHAPRATHKTHVDDHGDMWIILMQTTTSTHSIGQTSAAASSAMAGRIFASPEVAAHASMLARAWGSGSLGW